MLPAALQHSKIVPEQENILAGQVGVLPLQQVRELTLLAIAQEAQFPDEELDDEEEELEEVLGSHKGIPKLGPQLLPAALQHCKIIPEQENIFSGQEGVFPLQQERELTFPEISHL